SAYVSPQTTTNAVSPTVVASSISPSPSPIAITTVATTVATTAAPTTVPLTTTTSREVSSSSSSSTTVTTALVATTNSLSLTTTSASSSPTTSPSPTGNTGIPASTLRIIYGVLGAIGVIVILGGGYLIWNCYRKKAEDAEYLAEHKTGPVLVGPNHISSTSMPLNDRPPRQPQMAYYDDRSTIGHGEAAGSVYAGTQYGDQQSLYGQYDQHDQYGSHYSDLKVTTYPPKERYSDPNVQNYPPESHYDQKSGFRPIVAVSDPLGNNQFVDSGDVSDNQYVSAPRNQPGYIQPTIPVPSPYIQPVQTPYYDYQPQQYGQGYGQAPQQNYGYRN
ncbi:hypothetical protein HK096_004894, partial [Nowakowskiella sp. JEL0078]